jgi:hypothetical protein
MSNSKILSLFEKNDCELAESETYSTEDLQISPKEVSKILHGLKEGISILEKEGRNPNKKLNQRTS